MIQTCTETIKENKMKNCGKKYIVVLAALVIALGALMTMTGCKSKKSAPAAESPAKQADANTAK
jgi:flagellar basal body-associated protein FliL